MCFFKTYHDPQRGWMLNINPNKMLQGTEVEISSNKYNIYPGIQNVFDNSAYDVAKSMNDKEKLVIRDIRQKTEYYNRKPTKSRLSARDKFIKNDLHNDARKILNLDKKLNGRGVEKIIIPSNIIDICTRLEVLLGLLLSGHSDTLTEASNLMNELHKRGEIQNEQQYRNALNRFQT